MPRADGSLTDSEKREQLRGHFDSFWRAYPRKVGINEAERAFVSAVYGTKTRPPVDPMYLIQKAAAYAQSVDPGRVEFVPYPANWIAGGHYEDNDLFTDQSQAELEWLRGCYRRCDVRAVEQRFGITFPYHRVPLGMEDADEIERWHKAQVRAWITEQTEKITSE